MSLVEIIIYCDGACLGNPGPGGYAAILKSKNYPEKIIAGNEKLTTNNRMEMTAALAALKALKKPCQVKIYSDSQYVTKGMTEWIFTWQRNNFKNSHNKPIANQDLWLELTKAKEPHKVTWHWVKGHANDPLNIRVDELARQQAYLVDER